MTVTYLFPVNIGQDSNDHLKDEDEDDQNQELKKIQNRVLRFFFSNEEYETIQGNNRVL